jgi:hypothetical protein
LIIASTNLAVASGEAVRVSSDRTQNITTVEKGLGDFSGGEDGNGDSVVDSRNELGCSVAWIMNMVSI